ncbi:deoxyribonuclease V [Chitinophaga sp. sic0106]|uniref:deoxyribonuclease V n=1 Tax=Chitinophaga sp. sic0106 TaxID=2854785 RepID=UPI001C463C10|nr:deoxyribonuclease V [Chitinophaga sp. sic0106]MBV7534008.1 deoxyribonuclease V [Chitinophaga sp. sic0106]
MLTEPDAVAEQEKLRQQIITENRFQQPIRYIAGADVEYDKDTNLIAGAIAVLHYDTLEVAAVATHVMEVTFPYIPGLFSFREMPPLLAAWEKLTLKPDLIICDGHGIAHPRRFGMASHLGIMLNVPTIGCGKTKLYGAFEEPGARRGSVAPLLAEDDGQVIGSALRTQDNINPVFVSTGHLVSLDTATAVVLEMARLYRLPETTRIADHHGRLAMEAYKEKNPL